MSLSVASLGGPLRWFAFRCHMAPFHAIVSRSSRFRDLFFAMARICQSGCAALVEVARRVFWRCAAFSQLVGSRVAHGVCPLRVCVLCVASSFAAFVFALLHGCASRLKGVALRCCRRLLCCSCLGFAYLPVMLRCVVVCVLGGCVALLMCRGPCVCWV